MKLTVKDIVMVHTLLESISDFAKRQAHNAKQNVTPDAGELVDEILLDLSVGVLSKANSKLDSIVGKDSKDYGKETETGPGEKPSELPAVQE